MHPVRKATRKSVGNILTGQQVQEKYYEIIRSNNRLSREETLRTIRQFFDSDDVEVHKKTVSLLCPISKTRINDAARGSLCEHIECFDLRNYLEYHKTLAFWECPFTFCRQQVHCDQIRADEYMTDVIRNTPAEIQAIEVYSDGRYKPLEVDGTDIVTTIPDEERCTPQPLEGLAIKLEKETDIP